MRYANLPRQIESLIVTLKREKTHSGTRKIRELPVRRLDQDVRIPAKSAIHAVLHRHGLMEGIGDIVAAAAERRRALFQLRTGMHRRVRQDLPALVMPAEARHSLRHR